MSGYTGETSQPLRPRHFTRQMALPWHADFSDCGREGTRRVVALGAP
ncbi:MAG: LodA/GoxA family CTQ-dependent oxidase [Deltaproteobacteria bacterium]|nr:LodA/GoxA family CTQ-dependent oxidase [Deltaproteobacteria bacterium]